MCVYSPTEGPGERSHPSRERANECGAASPAPAPCKRLPHLRELQGEIQNSYKGQES